MPEPISSSRKRRSERAVARAFQTLAFLACMPIATWAGAPLTIPASLDASVGASGLVAAGWPFEIKAATASGMQSLGQPSVMRSVTLANLNQQADGMAQGFGNVSGSGHYRITLVDTANSARINYNFVISSTDSVCANTLVSPNENSLAAESGRWMEISLLKVEEGTASIAIAAPTSRACTNSRGKLHLEFSGIEAGKFTVEMTAFNEGNQPTGAYKQHILIEHPSDIPYTSIDTAR